MGVVGDAAAAAKHAGFAPRSWKKGEMAAFEVSRTLVKSPPEVWAELEQAERLAELLGDDAIKITRAEPETTIEWQGSTARGTIEIGASAWGTKVRMTAEAADPPASLQAKTEPAEVEAEREAAVDSDADAEAADLPEAVDQAEPLAEAAGLASADQAQPGGQPKRSLWLRLKGAFAGKTPAAESQPPAEAGAQPETVLEPERHPQSLPDPEPGPAPEVLSEPAPVAAPDAADATDADADADRVQPVDYESVLTAVLDHLGSAHKRPFTAT